MENNIEPKNEQASKQVDSSKKYKKIKNIFFIVIFAVVLVLSLSVSIGIFSSKLIKYQKNLIACKANVQNVAVGLGCSDVREEGKLVVTGIEILTIIIFSSILWLSYRKKDDTDKYKELLVVYAGGVIIIFLFSFFIIWILFDALQNA